MRTGAKETASFDLCSQTKQFHDKLLLTLNIALFDSLKLPFPYHVHRLISLNRPPRRWIRSEAQSRSDSAFHETVILFYNIVHVLAWSSLAVLRQEHLVLQIIHSADVGTILVDVDDAWGCNVRSAQHLAEEALGCSSASGLIQEEIEPLPC